MSEFDRIKPPDRRLVGRRDDERLDAAEPDPDGRAALFSSRSGPSGAAPGSRRLGVSVLCSRCGVTSALDPAGIVRAAFPLFLVLPGRDHPVFARCPACRVRCWLRPR